VANSAIYLIASYDFL